MITVLNEEFIIIQTVYRVGWYNTHDKIDGKKFIHFSKQKEDSLKYQQQTLF